MLIHYTSGSGSVNHNVPSRAPTVLAVGYSMIFIASVIVIMRITVKAKLGKLMIEDALIVVATV